MHHRAAPGKQIVDDGASNVPGRCAHNGLLVCGALLAKDHGQVLRQAFSSLSSSAPSAT
jgi:hypothetical protein